MLRASWSRLIRKYPAHLFAWALLPWVLGCGDPGADTGSTSEHSHGQTDGGGGSFDPPKAAEVPACDADMIPGPLNPADPGIAGTKYGPIMSGWLSDETQAFDLMGTATAVSLAGRSHLFFVGNPLPPGLLLYFSVLIDKPDWPTGTYSGPQVGALQAVTPDGCSYVLNLEELRERDPSFQLVITQSGQGEGGEFYVRGELSAELPSLNEKAPLVLRLTI